MEASHHQEPQPLTLSEVLSETRRIHKSNRRTFNALAFLFLFPSSLAAVLSQILAKSLSPNPDTAASKSLLFFSTPIPPKIIILLLAAAAYFLGGLVFTPCAVGSITYAAFQGFHGEPVKLKATIKSIAASFFPLLATVLAVQLIVFAATFAFAILVIVIVTTANATPLGLTASPYLLGFATAMFAVLMVYLQVNYWTLAYAVVVAESSRGFAALKRSKALIKGKRGLALSMSLFYGGFSLLLVLWSNYSLAGDFAGSLGGASRPPAVAASGWHGSFSNSATVFLFCSAMLTLVQLSNLVANAVLYVHCRDVNNSHSRGEYFSLPFDDENVALVV